MSDFDAIDWGHVAEILPRYSGEGPRYTSYPTAPVWQESYGAAQVRAELAREDVSASDGLALYVHVPFCESLCHFCACNKVITRKREPAVRFLEVVEREVAAVREALRVPREATQMHWGGGTPTFLSPEQLVRLHHVVTQAFPMRAGAEVSLEVDPRVTTAGAGGGARRVRLQPHLDGRAGFRSPRAAGHPPRAIGRADRRGSSQGRARPAS